ncbi:MAG: hypothetical protein ABFC12_02230 [Methanobacterium sp.]
MGISEKLEELSKKADIKERERGQKSLKKLFNYLENYEVEGLEEILSEIKDLSKSGLYNKLIKAATTDQIAPGTRSYTLEETTRVRILKLARDNLRISDPLTRLFSSSNIYPKFVVTIYTFIGSIYYINIGRQTNWDDSLNILFSGLDERLIFALDDFDTVNFDDLPEPTPEYFQKLRKVRWDKKAKKLYEKLTALMRETMELVLDYPTLIEWDATYRSTEDLFIHLLTGCSAVNDGRVEIEAEDVIRAYKTFFKLIKTNVTKYKAIPERIKWLEKQNGYLVCHDCGGYYQLQPGESPDDFSDTCDCGGELKYYEDIDWLLEKKEDSHGPVGDWLKDTLQNLINRFGRK